METRWIYIPMGQPLFLAVVIVSGLILDRVPVDLNDSEQQLSFTKESLQNICLKQLCGVLISDMFELFS